MVLETIAVCKLEDGQLGLIFKPQNGKGLRVFVLPSWETFITAIAELGRKTGLIAPIYAVVDDALVGDDALEVLGMVEFQGATTEMHRFLNLLAAWEI